MSDIHSFRSNPTLTAFHDLAVSKDATAPGKGPLAKIENDKVGVGAGGALGLGESSIARDKFVAELKKTYPEAVVSQLMKRPELADGALFHLGDAHQILITADTLSAPVGLANASMLTRALLDGATVMGDNGQLKRDMTPFRTALDHNLTATGGELAPIVDAFSQSVMNLSQGEKQGIKEFLQYNAFWDARLGNTYAPVTQALIAAVDRSMEAHGGRAADPANSGRRVAVTDRSNAPNGGAAAATAAAATATAAAAPAAQDPDVIDENALILAGMTPQERAEYNRLTGTVDPNPATAAAAVDSKTDSQPPAVKK